jgi:predicted nucleic acid-binding protein
MSFVLDNSITMVWFMPDEASESATALLHRTATQGAVVPMLWPIEIGNTLTIAVRRRRISLKQRTTALNLLSGLPIEVDAETQKQAWGDTLALADEFKLSLYDACYLELARRRRLPLASLDRDLRAAGAGLGLELLGI